MSDEARPGRAGADQLSAEVNLAGFSTEELRQLARNVEQGGYRNTEFRLGEIEHLPVADATVDVILSNCVINLSPDKPRVFAEAYRVLKPGGRLAILDVVAMGVLPEHLRQDQALYAGCMGGAVSIPELTTMLERSGFTDVRISPKDASRSLIRDWAPGTAIEDFVVSATIEAVIAVCMRTECNGCSVLKQPRQALAAINADANCYKPMA